jgi:hypothetical protein
MKTLITALALTAILATSAVAKTQRPKEVRVQPNNTLSHNAVKRSPTQINSYCRFEHGETDPDPRISSLRATVGNTNSITQSDTLSATSD